MDQREDLYNINKESAAAQPYDKCKNCGYFIRKSALGVWEHLPFRNILCRDTKAEPVNLEKICIGDGVHVAPTNGILEIHISDCFGDGPVFYLSREVEKELLSYLQARASAK